MVKSRIGLFPTSPVLITHCLLHCLLSISYAAFFTCFVVVVCSFQVAMSLPLRAFACVLVPLPGI